MLRNIRNVLQDPVNRSLWIVALVLNAATWAAIWRFVPKNSAVLPLHYTIYFGINLTGPWSTLLIVSAVGLALCGIHLWFASIVPHRSWQRLWLILALALNIVLAVDMIASIYYIRYSL